MKFYDLFGGIGGFRLGLQRASEDFECVGYADIDKFAVKSYNKIFGENHDPKDASELEPKELPDFDILCAGFPCQSFSIAGKRKGFEDTRGTLFFEIARIAKGKLPKILFLENVKGLLNHSDGKTFRKILETLDELGYDAEWQVLNSKYHGVPQNRERVFIIGHLRGESRGKVFPIRGEDATTSKENRRERNLNIHPSVTGAIGRAGSSREYLNSIKKVNQAGEFDFDETEGLNTTNDGCSYCIDSNYYKGVSPNDINSGRRTQVKVIDDYNQNYTEICGAVRQTNANKALGNGVKIMEYDRNNGLGQELDITPTVNKSDWRGLNRNQRQACVVQPIEDYNQNIKIRKLTPKECWRLQGFPDWAFEKAQQVNSDTQLYKQAGNAVTVNVIEKIGQRIHKIYENQN